MASRAIKAALRLASKDFLGIMLALGAVGGFNSMGRVTVGWIWEWRAV